MVYYAFYITEEGYDNLIEWSVPSLLVPEEPESTRPVELYALTSSKRYADIFRKTRDPKQFLERRIDIEDSRQDEFEMTYMDYLIHKHAFVCEYEKGDRSIRKQVVFPVPNFEYSNIEENWHMVLSDIVDEQMYETYLDWFESIRLSEGTIFTGIFQKAWSILDFGAILFNYGNPSEIPWDLGDQFNQLNGYRKLYERTYQRKGIMKLCTYGDFI